MVLILKPEWCECDATEEEIMKREVIYMPDNACRCGIDKHHYHCPECGCVEQIG